LLGALYYFLSTEARERLSHSLWAEAEPPQQGDEAMRHKDANEHSSLHFAAVKAGDLTLAKAITYPPTEENLLAVIDFLYKECVPRSKYITSSSERARLEEIVNHWSHFLRIWKGRLAYVPLG
jgi:hypothetical protein